MLLVFCAVVVVVGTFKKKFCNILTNVSRKYEGKNHFSFSLACGIRRKGPKKKLPKQTSSKNLITIIITKFVYAKNLMKWKQEGEKIEEEMNN